MVKIQKLPFAPDFSQKSPLSQHKRQETETFSPTLCKEDMATPHSWESIVFFRMTLGGIFAYTHFKLQR